MIPQNIVQKLNYNIDCQQDLARLEHLHNTSSETTHISVNICINIVYFYTIQISRFVTAPPDAALHRDARRRKIQQTWPNQEQRGA